MIDGRGSMCCTWLDAFIAPSRSVLRNTRPIAYLGGMELPSSRECSLLHPPAPLFLQTAPAGEGRKVILAETHFIVSSPPLSSVGLCLDLSVGSAIGELCCPTQTFYVFVRGNMSF